MRRSERVSRTPLLYICMCGDLSGRRGGDWQHHSQLNKAIAGACRVCVCLKRGRPTDDVFAPLDPSFRLQGERDCKKGNVGG